MQLFCDLLDPKANNNMLYWDILLAKPNTTIYNIIMTLKYVCISITQLLKTYLL